jgi:predicted enzyme related to lactoylglutathione lyase
VSTAEQSVTVRHVWPLLAVEKVERSIAFYRDMLGFSVAGRADVDGRPFWCRLERGGAAIMLQRADEEDGPVRGRGRGITFYFVCDDAERLREEHPTMVYRVPASDRKSGSPR